MKTLKKTFEFILLVFTLLSFSSCIEIIEEIKINPNKSGSIKFSLDLGFLGNSFIKMAKDYVDLSMLDLIKNQPNISAKTIDNTKGISNVIPISDDKKGLYALSFDFENVKALNEAFYKMFNANKNIFLPNVFKINKRTVKIANLTPVICYFAQKYEKDIKDNHLFSMITFKQTIILPRNVRKVKNPKSNIDNDRVNIKFTLDEILNKNVNIGNKIKF